MLSRVLSTYIILLLTFAVFACSIYIEPEFTSKVPAPSPSAIRVEVEDDGTGRSIVASALAALNDTTQPLSFTMASDSLDQEGNLQVRTYAGYTNMNEPMDKWLVSGRYVDPSRGVTFTFDSRHESTCMKVIAPEDKVSPWMYAPHRGWRNKDNPGRWTPPMTHIPVYFTPMPKWKVMARTDSEVVVTYDIELGKNFSHIVYVDNETRMVTRVEAYRKVGDNHHGQILGVRDYSKYGINAVGRVHRNRADCLSRN